METKKEKDVYSDFEDIVERMTALVLYCHHVLLGITKNREEAKQVISMILLSGEVEEIISKRLSEEVELMSNESYEGNPWEEKAEGDHIAIELRFTQFLIIRNLDEKEIQAHCSNIRITDDDEAIVERMAKLVHYCHKVLLGATRNGYEADLALFLMERCKEVEEINLQEIAAAVELMEEVQFEVNPWILKPDADYMIVEFNLIKTEFLQKIDEKKSQSSDKTLI